MPIPVYVSVVTYMRDCRRGSDWQSDVLNTYWSQLQVTIAQEVRGLLSLLSSPVSSAATLPFATNFLHSQWCLKTQLNTQVKSSQVEVILDRRSAASPCQASIWHPLQIFLSLPWKLSWHLFCNLRLLLGFSSALCLGSESRGTHDYTLLSQLWGSPNLEGQIPVFVTQGTKWSSSIYRHWIWLINSMAFSPEANYTDWATATCRLNLVPTFADRGVSRDQRRIPTVVNLSFLDRSRYFSFK
jgi:hypothetical protein